MSVTSGRYKSIAPPLSWPVIPHFAIVSGLNGSGKTQLLEVLAMQFDTHLRSSLGGHDLTVDFEGHTYNPHDVFYIDQFDRAFRNDTISVSNYDEHIRGLRSDNPTSIHDRFISQQARSLAVEDFPFDSLYLNLHMVDRAIIHQFLQFLVRDSNLARKGEDRSVLGDAPWDEINRSLQRSAFPYRFVAPEEFSMLKPLRLELLNDETNERILLRDLSSGEASLMRFMLFSFAARKVGDGPKLFLLDEPDAHLHCSLIQSFLIGVQKVLVESFGFRVIMTTHRTETLALAPEDTLYEMHRSGVRIRKSDAKARTISMLTGSAISLVYGGRRLVIVEDVPDVAFYRSVFGILRNNGEWRPTIEPVFFAASWMVGMRGARDSEIREGKAKAAEQVPKGGKGNVKVVVTEFNALGFQDIVFGLVDRDGHEAAILPNVAALERYAIENYLLDPLYVYVYLLHHNRRLDVAREADLGKEGELRYWSQEELQSIAYVVCEELGATLEVKPSEAERREVEVLYTSGSRIRVPSWLIKRRGKELLHAARKFAAPAYFSARELEVAMQRVGLIPVDLRKALEAAVGHVDSGHCGS